MPINKTNIEKSKGSTDNRNLYRKVSRRIAFVVLLTFTSSEIFPPSFISTKAYAQTILDLPVPGTILNLSAPLTPPILRGLTLHLENPFRFDFIVDQGETGLKGDDLKKEYEKLIKYFLATLTIPEDDLWVNLSPYEKERVIPNEFGKTEMGRDLLAQDYILKQFMASLTYPESGLGKKFWDEVYKKAYEQYGTTNIPLNTFNKVWIVPDKAVVYKNKNKTFIIESHLKVMLEEDYLALEKNMKNEHYDVLNSQESVNSLEPPGNRFANPLLQERLEMDLSDYAALNENEQTARGNDWNEEDVVNWVQSHYQLNVPFTARGVVSRLRLDGVGVDTDLVKRALNLLKGRLGVIEKKDNDGIYRGRWVRVEGLAGDFLVYSHHRFSSFYRLGRGSIGTIERGAVNL